MKRSSSVQRKGQITIPLELREEYNIQPGDEVYFANSPEGILITTEKLEKLARFNETLQELKILLAEKEKEDGKSYTLDELIESGREIRGQILKEKYGLESKGD